MFFSSHDVQCGWMFYAKTHDKFTTNSVVGIAITKFHDDTHHPNHHGSRICLSDDTRLKAERKLVDTLLALPIGTKNAIYQLQK